MLQGFCCPPWWSLLVRAAGILEGLGLCPLLLGFVGVLEELGLHLTSSHDVQDRLDDHRKIGSLTPTFQASAWVAKCNIAGHGSSCKFLLSPKPALGLSMMEAEADALAWLGAGTPMDAAEHLQLQKHVKKDYYKMKPRS